MLEFDIVHQKQHQEVLRVLVECDANILMSQIKL